MQMCSYFQFKFTFEVKDISQGEQVINSPDLSEIVLSAIGVLDSNSIARVLRNNLCRIYINMCQHLEW